jgi:glucose-1-phosphatase
MPSMSAEPFYEATIFKHMTNAINLSPDIQALLFDLGGVIIQIDWNRVFQQWARCSPLSAREMGDRFQMDTAYEQHERGQLSASQYFSYLRNVVEFKGSDESFLKSWNAVFVREVKDVVDLLPCLKSKVPIYLLTNSNPTHEAFWRDAYSHTINLFTDTFVSSTLGHRKPDQAAFDAVARKTGVALRSILFFDDTIENVEGAKAAGLRAVHVTDPSDVRRTLTLEHA